MTSKPRRWLIRLNGSPLCYVSALADAGTGVIDECDARAVARSWLIGDVLPAGVTCRPAS